jgi:endonuclease/exonuclease/phosphatase (EEP) superfamily protein YafD
MKIKAPVRPSNWRYRAVRLLTWLSWGYVALLVSVWLLLWLESDRWWLATVLMFGPRWMLALPLAVLVPAALLLRPRLLGWSLLGGFLVAVPIMNLCVPWRPLLQSPGYFRVRVLSCNVHYHELDALSLNQLIAEVEPDIVALQSWSSQHEPTFLSGRDWHHKRRQELFLASVYPIREVTVLEEPFYGKKGNVARFDLETDLGTLHFFNLHLATPRNGLGAILSRWWEGRTVLQTNSDLRLAQSAHIKSFIRASPGPTLIAGDFNTPADSTIYDEYWSSYTNAFSTAGWGWGHTFFSNRYAVRIDHQLGKANWQCKRCWVGHNVGSEHHPVIADWEWIGGNP